MHAALGGFALSTPLFGAVLALFPSCHEPIVRDTIEVSMVSLPKTDKKVPDRLARVKAETGSAKEPPPVKDSDLKFEDEKADPDPGDTEEERRQKIIEDAKRRQMLEELENAPEGPQDRNATDPNGSEEAIQNQVLAVKAQGDQRVARWSAAVRDKVQSHFHPLGDAGDLACVVLVRFEPSTGAVSSYEIKDSSGAVAFDSAAERAVEETGTLPAGLPEEYWPMFRDQGVGVRLKAK
jgi:hypothetical protein